MKPPEINIVEVTCQLKKIPFICCLLWTSYTHREQHNFSHRTAMEKNLSHVNIYLFHCTMSAVLQYDKMDTKDGLEVSGYKIYIDDP
jgi:hypothetical protein